jgi:hypothetical protein
MTRCNGSRSTVRDEMAYRQAQAIAADLSRPEERTQYLGLMQVFHR